MKLAGWGRFPIYTCHITAPRNEVELSERIAQGNAIARGNGRAYGDSALSRENTIEMRHFNRMLTFDAGTGQLVVEAGVLLEDIISSFLPRGWFPFVTPGTKYVTVGGMIAADVHGKNHHKDGSFGSFVDWIDVFDHKGEVVRCTPTENSDLFGWTLGGMGLTGIILRAAVRLRPVETGWIKQTMIPAPNLFAAMDVFEQSQDATYSVAWIDCLSKGASLGRSLVMLGEHAELSDLPMKRRASPFVIPDRLKLNVPMDAPSFALNRLTVQAFNAVFYHNGARTAGSSLVNWDSYFYPLDAILRWNRIYGRKGFAQFQCVLPLSSSKAGLQALLETVSEAGQSSFLAVLKRFGEQDSRFSFPMKGFTLAMDFPVTKKTLTLMKELDRITIEHGGRLYLAKDSRMTAETIRHSDRRTNDFIQMRHDTGSDSRFASSQSERLEI